MPVPVFFSEKLSNGTHMLQKDLNFLILHFKTDFYTRKKHIQKCKGWREKKTKLTFIATVLYFQTKVTNKWTKQTKDWTKYFILNNMTDLL